MGTMCRGFGKVLLIAAVATLWAVSPASAADTIVAEDECCTFAPGPYFQDLGEIPTFDNPATADAPHNVTSTVTGPDGSELFGSNTIAAGDTSPVYGTQYLGAGTYPFFCTLHGPSMSGDLVVEAGKGAVVARPSILVSIPGQRLKKVRKSGTIKVRVKARTLSPAVAVKVRRGRKAIASSPVIRLKAGATRTLKLKLSRKGRKAVANGRKIGVSATGTVAFGKPSSAKRTLR